MASEEQKEKRQEYDRLFKRSTPALIDLAEGKINNLLNVDELVREIQEYCWKKWKSSQSHTPFLEFLKKNIDIVITKLLASKANDGDRPCLNSLYKIYENDDAKIVAIKACLEEDQEALSQLAKIYYKPLLGRIKTRIRNIDHAEVLCHEIWEKCLIEKHSYNPYFSFYTFLTRFSRFKVLDYFRKEKHSRTKLINPTSKDLSEIPVSEDEPSDNKAIITIAPVPGEILEKFEKKIQDMKILHELTCIIFNCSIFPHKIVAFVIDKHLGYEPQEIVADHFYRPLVELTDELKEKYLTVSEHLVDQIEDLSGSLHDELSAKVKETYHWFFQNFAYEMSNCFTPFYNKLIRLVEEIYKSGNWKWLRDLAGTRIIGSTELELYYLNRANKESAIYDNNYRMKPQIQAIIEEIRSTYSS